MPLPLHWALLYLLCVLRGCSGSRAKSGWGFLILSRFSQRSEFLNSWLGPGPVRSSCFTRLFSSGYVKASAWAAAGRSSWKLRFSALKGYLFPNKGTARLCG